MLANHLSPNAGAAVAVVPIENLIDRMAQLSSMSTDRGTEVMNRITLEQQSAWLAERKRQLGLSGRDYVPANSGGRRAAAKRALLEKLADINRTSRRALRFVARY